MRTGQHAVCYKVTLGAVVEMLKGKIDDEVISLLVVM